MEREEALHRLKKLVGQDLRPLADEYGVTVWKESRLNKGWAGHVVERYLGLPQNSSRAPNFGSWELKLVPLKTLKSNQLAVKETMAITMLDPVEVASKDFEDSHLYTKLRKLIVAARIFSTKEEKSAIFHAVSPFDLNDPMISLQVKSDYNVIRQQIRSNGFESLSGSMGTLIQPRTKGAGYGSTSKAFYARTKFVSHILGISRL